MAAIGEEQVASTEGQFLEADAKGTRYRVRIVKAGPSANGNIYPADVLREAAPLFEGVRVFVKGDEEHLAGKGRDVRNLVGRIVNVSFVEAHGVGGCQSKEAAATPGGGELQGDLEMVAPDGTVATQVREAVTRGMGNLFGLSIDAKAVCRTVESGGRRLREARKFTKVHSVDLIVEPGAGGEVLSMIEAARHAGDHPEETDAMLRTELLSVIEAERPELLEGKDATALTDAQLDALFREAVRRPQAPKASAGETTEAPVTRQDVERMVRLVEARAEARAQIAASHLPQAAKDRLTAEFDMREAFEAKDVGDAIKAEGEYLAKFVEGGAVRGLGDVPRVKAGESRAEKVAAMLDAFFDREHKDHRHAQSFKECYIEITGDKNITGSLRNCDEATLRESLGTGDLTMVLGDAIHRRLVADYRTPDRHGLWRSIADVTRATDFRTNERTRWGGYGDLPKVAEGAAYGALTSPGDEKVTYAVEKRGGTEDLTLEAIKADDVGLIRRIPTNLGRAAKRTLAKFVFDFIRTNPLIYDGIALFHASHGNLGAAALDKTALAAGRLAMLKQQELGSNEPLDIGPRFLLVPPELEEGAVDLFRRNTENDKTFVQSLALDVIPVWYWTDINDWALVADPLDIPTIEIAFLDGQEEPELFVQDNPTVGSMFSHDKLTWKIRHVYGGNVLDYRGMYKAVVA